MPKKILMLGGRRAGKSSVLACILEALKATPGGLCTFLDITDYTEPVIDKNGIEHYTPTLHEKKLEISQHIRRRDNLVAANNQFTVDMKGQSNKYSYLLQSSINAAARVDFEFIDVPGEWMRANVPAHADLIEEIKAADVFIIAIDTPYLMFAEDDVNSVNNRIQEITNAICKIKINDDEYDKKLILLCPIKCEKWLISGKGEEVTDKVCLSYRDLINSWVAHPNVTIQIIPVLTAGGIEFSKLLPGKTLFRTDTEQIGESCSIDNGVIILRDGRSIKEKPGYRIEEDESFIYDHTPIPLSWYKTNGKGFTPSLCEQPAYQILRFLVNKEAHIEQKKKEFLNHFPALFVWVWKIFYPTFGTKLPTYTEFIRNLESQGLIKENGNGFRRITESID